MSANLPVSGGEEKPAVKANNKSPFQHGGRNNANHCGANYIKKEKFLGADHKLRGQVFEAKHNRSDQVANFNIVNELIKAQVRAECDPFVLESLEKETLTLPVEPTPIYKAKNNPTDPAEMAKIEEMKFKSKFDK